MVIRRISAYVVALSVLLLLSNRADAWSVRNAVMDGCHEQMTNQAYGDILSTKSTLPMVLPDNEIWRQVSTWVLSTLPIDENQLDDIQRFRLTSLIIGVRAPDTEGHATFDIPNQRKMNLNTSPEAQYAHALRGSDDDFEQGNVAAVKGTQNSIRQLIDTAREYSTLAAKDQIVTTRIYVDFYGEVEVEVWAPSYYLGRAAHAVQDSFSHMIRSEVDSFRKVVHVMNFIEAITGKIDEKRDGLAHGTSMDDCSDDATSATYRAAVQATIGLFAAHRAYVDGSGPPALDKFFDKWFEVKEACTLANDLCRNGAWLDLVRQGQTELVSTATDRAQIQIVVADDGKGMDARDLERASDDFFTTKATGTGLGLAFARRVADAHDGTLKISSVLGKGTSIQLRLPVDGPVVTAS